MRTTTHRAALAGGATADTAAARDLPPGADGNDSALFAALARFGALNAEAERLGEICQTVSKRFDPEGGRPDYWWVIATPEAERARRRDIYNAALLDAGYEETKAQEIDDLEDAAYNAALDIPATTLAGLRGKMEMIVAARGERKNALTAPTRRDVVEINGIEFSVIVGDVRRVAGGAS